MKLLNLKKIEKCPVIQTPLKDRKRRKATRLTHEASKTWAINQMMTAKSQ